VVALAHLRLCSGIGEGLRRLHHLSYQFIWTGDSLYEDRTVCGNDLGDPSWEYPWRRAEALRIGQAMLVASELSSGMAGSEGWMGDQGLTDLSAVLYRRVSVLL
jgi:hypothetical protein